MIDPTLCNYPIHPRLGLRCAEKKPCTYHDYYSPEDIDEIKRVRVGKEVKDTPDWEKEYHLELESKAYDAGLERGKELMREEIAGKVREIMEKTREATGSFKVHTRTKAGNYCEKHYQLLRSKHDPHL